jgi:hypothetical protein
MKSAGKTMIAITVTGVLTGSALAALADAPKGKPFEGVVVQDVVVLDQFPREVQSGSIQTKDDNEQAMAAKSQLSSNQAADIAVKAVSGKALETRLDDENGYLVWEVETIDDQGQQAQLKIDAGNGRLLAVETGDKGEHRDGDREDHHKGMHSRWKFWEDHDRDEGQVEQD